MRRRPIMRRGDALSGLENRGDGLGAQFETPRPFASASPGDGIACAGSVESRRPASGVGWRFAVGSRSDGIIDAARASPRRRESRQRGYTLIEVLVAFSVLALALTLLLGTLSGATRQVRWSADAGRAALHAQSLLAQTGVGEALQPGRRDGEFEDGRYRWVLEVAPYTDPLRPAPTITEPFSSRLMEVRLVVEWGGGDRRQRMQLDTLRLVQPDPAQGAIP